MNANEEHNNVAFANASFSRIATPSGVPSTFVSRRSAARAVAAVASTGLLVGMGAVGVGPALAAPAPAVTGCTPGNTITAPATAAGIQSLLDSNTPFVCLSGTFTLANPLTFNHNLTLIGLTPGTVLNGAGVTRILLSTGNTTLTVSNLEFRQGLAETRFDSNFTLLDEGQGGAILTDGQVAIFGSRFSSNLGGKDGGAISASGTVGITDSTFVDNEVDSPMGFNGGAVSAGGAITVTNSTFLGNVATGQGGAISSGAGVVVTGSTFTSNQAQGDGGAIFAVDYVGGSTPSTGSTFTNNTADSNLDGFGSGGAIYANNSISVNQYAFSGNTAANGGALYSGSTVNTLNSTFFANIATDEGGAIYARGGSVAFSTFFNNQAAVFIQGTPDIPGQAIYLEASSGSVLPIEGSIFVGRPVESQLGVGGGGVSAFDDVGGNVFSTTSAQEPNLPTPASLLFGQSALALFGTTTPVLAANRGTTQTLALVFGSPAIGAGLTSSSVLSDQRGLLRPGLGSTRADAGAFEFQAVIPGQVNGLTASPGTGSVALSWSAASNDGDSPITDYVIEQNSGSGWVRVVDGVSTATSFTVTGLTNGNSYQFRVSAVNAVGSGVVSAVSSSVTPAAPTASTAPVTPAVLAATGSSPGAGWLAGGAALLMALGSALMVMKRRRFR